MTQVHPLSPKLKNHENRRKNRCANVFIHNHLGHILPNVRQFHNASHAVLISIPMIHFTNSGEPGDPTNSRKGDYDQDDCLGKCFLCDHRYPDTMLYTEDKICESCLPGYIQSAIDEDEIFCLGEYSICKNILPEDVQYGYWFRHLTNPLTKSFTVPTLEEGLKKIL